MCPFECQRTIRTPYICAHVSCKVALIRPRQRWVIGYKHFTPRTGTRTRERVWSPKQFPVCRDHSLTKRTRPSNAMVFLYSQKHMYDLGVISCLIWNHEVRSALARHAVNFHLCLWFLRCTNNGKCGCFFYLPLRENALAGHLFIPRMYIRSMAFSPFPSLLIEYRGMAVFLTAL